MAPREKVILDEYVTKTRIPKTCAREVYKLTNKELDTLCKGTVKSHGFFRTPMTLYSREKVLTLACKKYGCTRKNIAEVLQMDKPPIVNPLIENPPRKTPQKKIKETPPSALSLAATSSNVKGAKVSSIKAPRKTYQRKKKETPATAPQIPSSSTGSSSNAIAMPNSITSDNVVVKLVIMGK